MNQIITRILCFQGAVVTSCVAPKKSSKLSRFSILPPVLVGMEVRYIANMPVVDKPYATLMRLLDKLPRPLTIVFGPSGTMAELQADLVRVASMSQQMAIVLRRDSAEEEVDVLPTDDVLSTIRTALDMDPQSEQVMFHVLFAGEQIVDGTFEVQHCACC